MTPMDAKNLTLDELEMILRVRASDVTVYIGMRGNICLTSEVLDAGLNGAQVQLNLKSSKLDDVMQDSNFAMAFEKGEYWRAF